MKVLITGSDGFVGRAFTRRLGEDGHDLTLLDIRRGKDCRALFRGSSGRYFDLVLHCAALVGGRATIDGSPLAIAGNLGLDVEALAWAVQAKPRRFVYFSSSAAYPVELQARDTHVWLAEDHIDLAAPRLPDAMYGWAKLTGEMNVATARQLGLGVTVVRPFSGYGTDQDLAYPFPKFIARAKSGQRPFEVWGDGTGVRDWVHIDDIVEATLVAADAQLDGPFNLCTGRPMMFDDLARMVTGDPRIEIAHIESAPTGVHHRVGDPSWMHKLWEPKVSLEEGVARALDGRL